MTTSVLNKLDKLETLLRPKRAWAQHAYVFDSDGIELDDDKVKSKEAASWCLAGGVIKVGNGAQLFWELALSCDAQLANKVMTAYDDYKMFTEDEVEPLITGFNDNRTREHKEILKAIRDTRKRIEKKGLTPLPKLRQEPVLEAVAV